MKKFILGTITGAILCLSISALANFEAIPNAFPIKLNGNEVSLEGYNINGSTYFKLRDIGDKVGFGVDFADNTININVNTSIGSGISQAKSAPKSTSESVVNPTPIPWSEVPPQATEVNKNLSTGSATWHDNGLTSDGLPIFIENGQKGVSGLDIEEAYNFEENHLAFGVNELYDKTNGYVTILSDIKNLNSSDIDYEYYETVLRPFLISYIKWDYDKPFKILSILSNLFFISNKSFCVTSLLLLFVLPK